MFEEEMAEMDNTTIECIEEIGILAYKLIFLYTNYANYLAVVIPLIAGLGSAGNLFAVYINHYRRVSGLSVSFLNAILVMDCAFLVSLVFMYSPRGHLPRLFTVTDCAEKHNTLWTSIDYAQRTYVITHPLMDLARLLVVWFTLAYVYEHYAALFHQERLVNLAKAKSAPMKIIVIVFNIAAILSLIHFFKYVRKEALYDKVEHLEVCLSDVYMASAYINYDIYVYFGIFLVFPWFLVLIAVLKITVEVRRRAREKREIRRLSWKETFISIDVKEARSHVVVLSIGIMFLICYGIGFILYIYIVSKSGVVRTGVLCFLVPLDWRFSAIDNGYQLEWFYSIIQIVYSSIKFPICYIVGKTFRLAVNKWWRNVFRAISACCGGLGRMCCILKKRKDKDQVASISYDNRTFLTNITNRSRDQLDKRRASYSHRHYQNNHRHHQHHEQGSQDGSDITRYSPTIQKPQSTLRNTNVNKARPYVITPKQRVHIVWESNV